MIKYSNRIYAIECRALSALDVCNAFEKEIQKIELENTVRVSLGYNDHEHFEQNRNWAFHRIKAVWQESINRSKIKVKACNIFGQIKELVLTLHSKKRPERNL